MLDGKKKLPDTQGAYWKYTQIGLTTPNYAEAMVEQVRKTKIATGSKR